MKKIWFVLLVIILGVRFSSFVYGESVAVSNTTLAGYTIVNTGDKWKYSQEEQPGWTGSDFDDSQWTSGITPFGNATYAPCVDVYNAPTYWAENTTLYLRKEINISKEDNLSVFVAIDNDITIYIDGQQVFSTTSEGCAERWEYNFSIPSVKVGAHIIAIKIVDRGVATGFDMKIDTNYNQNQNNTINLPRTGQTTCYNASGSVISCAGTGQDGDSLAGVEWPSPRFTDNGNSTITDNLSGLMWMQDASTPTVDGCTGGEMTWVGAFNYVSCLNTANFAGYSDWRIPNREELISITDKSNYNPALPVDHLFNSVKTSQYWSSTTYAFSHDPVNAWIVSMSSGWVDSYTKGDSHFYVWPVRLGQQVRKSGQTTSYQSNDDGDLEVGVEWPNPRFTNNSDETITDNLTGLMWAQNASTPTVNSCAGGTMIWSYAFDYISCLNAIAYLGYSDWRLPNINELGSLVNAERENIASWLNSEGFSSANSGWYWSSTTLAHATNHAWFVSMYSGSIKMDSKLNSNYVLPVRLGATNTLITPTPTSTPTASPTPTPTSTPVTYTLTLLKEGSGGGSIKSEPSGINCGGTCSSTFESGQDVALTTTAASNAKIIGWDDCDSVSEANVCFVNMDKDKTITVRISTKTDKILKITKKGKGSGTVTADSGTLLWTDKVGVTSYKEGKQVTLTAVPDNASKFVSWTNCDTKSKSGKVCAVTMNKRRELTVKFKPNSNGDVE
ncbi:MAG: DUF1566 domain-containing protein [Candidatus Magnetoovum sp. WYHC-5]|nr:DUF1566 domain-containing protein [Candidatus Magnetoovum sp. WYHC-5]